MIDSAEILTLAHQDNAYLCFVNNLCQSKLPDSLLVNAETGEIQVMAAGKLKMIMVYDQDTQPSILRVHADASVAVVLLYVNKTEHELTIYQERNSQLQLFQIAVNAEALQNSLSIHLQAVQASCRINGLGFADQQQCLSTQLAIWHHAPQAVSEVHYKSIADQKGQIKIAARVQVSPGAVNTLSDMNLNNLLLSNTAEIDTQPELEIYADDVKCSHGATVGDLDEEALFYLLSRGIDPQRARSMLILAFMQTLIDQLDPLLQPLIISQLKHKLDLAERLS